MLKFNTVTDYRSWFESKGMGHKIGFVPTMGALHQGHVSLLKKSKSENDISVLSIFVNPTQFNSSEDFKNYPQTLENDLQVAEKAGVDIVFLPNYVEIYGDNYRFKVSEHDFSFCLCGARRPGHFDGVLTVVLKLLNIIGPAKAYFGEKDFQQLSLIKDMAKHFFLSCEIVGCPTMREPSGLAMSSRNQRLDPEQTDRAKLIYQSISQSKSASEANQKLQDQGFLVDYVVDYKNRRYVAAYVGQVRLIDNVKI